MGLAPSAGVSSSNARRITIRPSCRASPNIPANPQLKVRAPLRVRLAKENDISYIKVVLADSGSDWTDSRLEVRHSEVACSGFKNRTPSQSMASSTVRDSL
jgi:hypothetical protein